MGMGQIRLIIYYDTTEYSFCQYIFILKIIKKAGGPAGSRSKIVFNESLMSADTSWLNFISEKL
jgi:hypothetical protein